MSEAPSPKRALLVIDMQSGLFHGPDRPHDGERVLGNEPADSSCARNRCACIRRASHRPGRLADRAQCTDGRVAALAIDTARDIVFDKTRPSCFAGTRLAEWLHAKGIGEIVIAGMKTQYCIDTACRAADDLGFRAVLVTDAHTCMDTPALPAERIVAHHNATLGGPFATLTTAEACAF
ncbi:isochorismatase family protein [Burkholderia sp. Bp8998]|uniref:isochorismatase family protein n=1 Tax=Burkholderia sp. Bp8998 TaxID=2184557 RepID=UPI000F5A9373|nr:isochorismatase family protein [Burkholderia sp. Bp8998]RQS18365.1 isochorismatase family protein [Burkholderia sp. Bp8998]